MTTTVSKTSQSALVGFAVLLFGMAMYELNTETYVLNTGNVAVAIFLFALVAVIAFFVFVVETPAKDLPVDLQQLQKVLDNTKDVNELISEVEKYLPELDSIVALLSSGENTKAILKSLMTYAPQLETVATQFMAQLSAQKIDLSKVDWATLIQNVLKNVPVKA